jgi:hypothetical protein
MGKILTGFAGSYRFSCIIDHCWPIEPLLKDFGGYRAGTDMASADSYMDFRENFLTFGFAETP